METRRCLLTPLYSPFVRGNFKSPLTKGRYRGVISLVSLPNLPARLWRDWAIHKISHSLCAPANGGGACTIPTCHPEPPGEGSLPGHIDPPWPRFLPARGGFGMTEGWMGTGYAPHHVRCGATQHRYWCWVAPLIPSEAGRQARG